MKGRGCKQRHFVWELSFKRAISASESCLRGSRLSRLYNFYFSVFLYRKWLFYCSAILGDTNRKYIAGPVETGNFTRERNSSEVNREEIYSWQGFLEINRPTRHVDAINQKGTTRLSKRAIKSDPAFKTGKDSPSLRFYYVYSSTNVPIDPLREIVLKWLEEEEVSSCWDSYRRSLVNNVGVGENCCCN